jgi:hypothetical protein
LVIITQRFYQDNAYKKSYFTNKRLLAHYLKIIIERFYKAAATLPFCFYRLKAISGEKYTG